MALKRLVGKTGLVATRIVSALGDKKAPYHRITEVFFPSMLQLSACLNSAGGHEAALHAIEISTGGIPVFLVSEIESTDF